jgi:hypothetical protein
MTDRDRCRLHTTGRLARQADACQISYDKLQAHLGGESYGLDTPIGLDVVCEVLGLNDALWALRCVLPEEEAERDRIARPFVCESTERVLPIFERLYPTDLRPRHAIAVARRFAMGEATTAELAAAAAATSDAARAAGDVAWVAASDAAEDAAWAAWAAARAVAWAAAGADGDVAWAAWAAARAARAAACDATARDTAWAARAARAAAYDAAARDTAWAASYTRADAGADARAAAWIADWATGTEYYAQQEIFLRLLH